MYGRNGEECSVIICQEVVGYGMLGEYPTTATPAA